MTGRPEAQRPELDCAAIDELAGAYALGALEPAERAAIDAHVASCPRPHTALREAMGADGVMAASVDPIPPSPALRDRVLATVAQTPQDHRAPERAPRTRWSWVTRPAAGWLRPIAAAAVIVALTMVGWNLSLQNQLSNRDASLRAVAAAIGSGSATYRATGSAGTGYLVADPNGNASLVVSGMAPPAAGHLYELWLITPGGTPVDVGTFPGSSQAVSVVPLERGLAGYATFAVTVETHRVAAPAGQAVMSASLGG